MRIRELLTLLFILCTINLSAQNLDALREEIKQAEAEIRKTNTLLSKTQKDKKATDSQLKLIRNKIRNRKNIVTNLEKQEKLVIGNIESKSDTVFKLERNLQRLRSEYSSMVYEAYKNYKLNNFVVFLFASKDFNDITRRIAYMRRYNNMRQQKAAQIDTMTQKINSQITDLSNKKDELSTLQKSRVTEIETLGKDETQFNSTVKQLASEERKLSSTIRNKQNQINSLQSKIKAIIAEENRKNKSRPQTTAEIEYDAKLSGKFDQNIGKLPYPVRGGVIVDRFGSHPHPTQPNVKITNNGVNIAAEAGAQIKAVFEGEVSRVFFVAGMNNSILIRHGNYITVYSNLETVNVKAGDKITLNQVVGQLSSSGKDDSNVLHFEIWRETTNLNPESWLKR